MLKLWAISHLSGHVGKKQKEICHHVLLNTRWEIPYIHFRNYRLGTIIMVGINFFPSFYD